jgi:6-phosphogluconate dehydrogenase (decarboxylating)
MNMRTKTEMKNDMVMKLNGATLTITKRDTFDVDIETLADIYEQAMIDELYDNLTNGLDLDSDIADYVEDNGELRDKILSLVKAEMFKRVSAKSLTIITKV